MSRKYFVQDPLKLTPREFELAVKELIRRAGLGLLSFEVQHLETLQGTDGNYTIDVTARFEELGVNFLVLIECKRHKDTIKRSDVQIMHDKLRSLGAQKGMIFSASEIQRGAINYASKHRIALIQLIEGELTYFTKPLGGIQHKPPSWADLPKYAGYIVRPEGKSTQYTSFLEYAKEMLPQIYNYDSSS
jgi:restriction system protein